MLTNRSIALAAAAAWALSACSALSADEVLETTSLYSLVTTVEGVAFYPPLGPDPAPASGSFDGSVHDGLRVVLEATSAAGVTTEVAHFDRTTSPSLLRVDSRGVYFVNVPAAEHFTNAALAYRFRVLLDGYELGRSDLSSRVFSVLERNPGLLVGVKLRVEQRAAPVLDSIAPTSAVAAAGAVTLTLRGSAFVPDSVVTLDGVALATTFRSSSELVATVSAADTTAPGTRALRVSTPRPGGGTSVARSLAVIATCSDGVMNGGETIVDCGGPCGAPNTYYRDADGDGHGAAANGVLGCVAPAGYVTLADDCNDASASVLPGATEVCNGIDDNCDGRVDEYACVCSSMTGHWPFDEGSGVYARETQGARDGFLVSSPVWTSGRVGGAVRFTGTNYVEVPDTTELEPHRSSFSVEAWALIPAGQRGQRRIVTHGTHGGRSAGYALMEWCAWGNVPCGGVAMLLGIDNGGEYLIGTCNAMDDGRWHHYAAIANRGGMMELYVDGAKVTAPCSGTANGAAGWSGGQVGNISHLANVDIDASCSLCIGASCQSSGSCAMAEYWTGTIDEVAVWMRPLAAAEVADHYATGTGHTSCVYPQSRPEICDGSDNDLDGVIDDGACSCSSLAGYWRLDENSGRYARDTENGKDGLLVSSPTWRSGKLGASAVTFNGSNYVMIPDDNTLDPHYGDFSVEAWVQIPAGQRGQRRIVAHGSHGGGGYDGYSLMQWCAWGGVPCGGVGLLLGANGRGEYLVGTCRAMDDGAWHHYAAVVRRTGVMELYVDGARLTSPCTGSTAAWGSGQAGNVSHLANEDLDCPCALCLGGSCQSSGACGAFAEPYTGSLDEVAYWNRALSASEIAGHYASGNGARACGN